MGIYDRIRQCWFYTDSGIFGKIGRLEICIIDMGIVVYGICTAAAGIGAIDIIEKIKIKNGDCLGYQIF